MIGAGSRGRVEPAISGGAADRAGGRATITGTEQDKGADLAELAGDGRRAKVEAVLEAIERRNTATRLMKAATNVPSTAHLEHDEAAQISRLTLGNGTTRGTTGTGENEWYTPAEYIEMAREVMGGIDLDPASLGPCPSPPSYRGKG